MHNFGTLYRCEVRKILCRKLTLIVLAAMLLLLIALNAAEYVAGSRLVTHADSVLAGRVIDDTLLDEMRQAIRLNVETNDEGERSVTGVEVLDERYKPLYDKLYFLIGNNRKAYELTQAQLEKFFSDIIETDYAQHFLTQDEKDYWDARRDALEIPPRYAEEGGWGNSLIILYMSNFLLLISIAATLSGVFSDEYTLRTDALLLSSTEGKKRLCTMKFLAGLSVGLLEALLILGVNIGVQFAISGAVDASASLQLRYGPSAMDMPAQNALLICCGIMLILSLFYSAFTMCLSQLSRNATLPMAAMALLLILSMLNPPKRFRLISQIASYMPATFPGSWTFTDYRLVTIFGQQFNILQVLPILYFLLTLLIAGILYQSYRRTQIGGR